ncbi:hypothetical protein D0T84_19310 [Dysgonomonas sp. 521]|uniref:hypothetical protein n=1 Tax=Dysgonomonas sp. 521 TaxID=2302932 RepID=UPI0013D58535|nr:hypothetical protein [Dysgonomonas sp. 521]NDV97037.1 hypothetical protein [Dysgonomonas sp. 521]
MKKLLLFILLAVSLPAIQATSNNIAEYKYNDGKGYPYGRNYPKGNMSPKQLPAPILKYLNENYPGYSIIVSKRKGNGNYFVKIAFGSNQYRSYYRSLVFDHEGTVIKG